MNRRVGETSRFGWEEEEGDDGVSEVMAKDVIEAELMLKEEEEEEEHRCPTSEQERPSLEYCSPSSLLSSAPSRISSSVHSLLW